MNKYIEMAKNRANHTVEELKKNRDDAYASYADAGYVYASADSAASAASDLAYVSESVVAAAAAAKSDAAADWSDRCDKYINKYKELTK